jgi:hypothetical protein
MVMSGVASASVATMFRRYSRQSRGGRVAAYCSYAASVTASIAGRSASLALRITPPRA